ncbi:MAG: hydroxymethylbilane synthase [Candidatus Omnitrophota bacterium]
MQTHLKVGTRPSPLAIKQVEEIERLFPFLSFEVIAIKTKGDIDKHNPLSRFEGTDFFTREIEQALLLRQIDIAVHSAKDLEEDMPDNLMVVLMTNSISQDECLVSKSEETLKELPFGAIIGTSSIKRKQALSGYRSDLVIKDIRGNIDERLRQLDNGDFDAIVVAHAALIRLGYENRISQIIPEEIIPPHPLQGRIAIQIRKDRWDLREIFQENK